MTLATDPVKIGHCDLKHRIVMAPMTRLRADDDHVPQDIVYDYYTQRASVPGTLLITEASFISEASRGRDENAPGIYSPEQIAGWRKITDQVHKQGSYIFLQLWHVGRAARQNVLDKIGLDMVSSSDVCMGGDYGTPRPMTETEIKQCIADFAQASHNAVFKAGFDGIELHAANGYLIDQFTQDTCNRRTDAWGGSIENRSRFCLEIVRAVSDAIGPERLAIRLSPWSDFQGMRMADPVPQFTYLITELRKIGKLAYLHLVEPNVSGNADKKAGQEESLDFALKAWDWNSAVIFAGGYTLERANAALQTKGKDRNVAFAFGRHFISNPDLPYRLANNIPLVEANRESFYDPKNPKGYIDWPFCAAWQKSVM